MPTSPLDYFKALAVCLLVVSTYEVLISPWLVGDVKVGEIPIRLPSDDADARIHQYFKAGAWQLDSPKQIETEIGVLLFQNWQRLSDNRWKLSPVTLMLRGSEVSDVNEADRDADEAMRRPILLEAPGGAEIEFAESLAVIDGSTPPVKGGHLIGNVQIVGPATRPDGSDRLQINASDVRINGKKIWTTAPVRVQVGSAIAEGRDLTITLAGGGKIPTGRTDSPLAVLNDLTLIYLDRLQVPVPQGSLWPALPEVIAARELKATDDVDADGMLTVRCGGALRFDFSTYTLSLSNQVTIEHQSPGLPADQVQCGSLAIELEDPFGNSVAKPTPERMVRRIRAFGGRVLLDAPTLLSRITAEAIDADFRSGIVRISGSKGIAITHRAWQLLMNDFEYRFTPGKPEDLIQLKAVGTGKLIAHDPSMPFRSFGWKDQLRVTPQPGANKYQLWMLQASAILPDDGRIRTDSLGLGFTLLPAGADSSLAGDNAPAGGRFKAESLVAKGNVLFDTREVYAETDQLDLFIETIDASSSEEKHIRLRSAQGRDLRSWTREPDAKIASVAGGASGSRSSQSRPHLRGKTLSANILTDGSSAVAHEFSINEDVRIEHVLDSQHGPVPVVLTGRELIFVDGDHGRIVQVSGFPAQVEVADGFFRSEVLQLRMGDNSLFMDRAGEFQMPSTMLAGNSVGKYRWIAPPRCTWQGQMHFNGRTANLLRGINMTGAVTSLDEPTRWDLHVGCESLEVSLAARINFSQPDSARKSEVERLSFKGSNDRSTGVVLSAVQRNLQGGLIGSHQMQVPTLDLFPSKGNLLGSGPGWYHAWSKPKLTDSGPLAAMSKAGGWLAAHLVYQEKLEGNIHNRTLQFVRGVRVAVSPVANEEQRIDANRIVEAQPGQSILDCDQLIFSQTPTAHQFGMSGQSLGKWEAKAMSNVVFQGRNEKGLFRGTADRLGYVADKDLFLIEGARNRPAELQRQYAGGQSGGKLKAHVLKFKPRTFELLDLQLHSINLGNLQQGFGIPPTPQATNPAGQSPRF